ncbi:uncharacterized protein N7473_000515 [Penicillium subrubescens]|uniref:Uncharacterized protein n=1 Tax=Penicillium subrubescens TaxID=1316194 RepID=A0A1Q5SU89_9EURO|nr:uncharacterized protein N7473_000515 [Penicillium subrubescens]KAJ5911212.1 hypothetical protein N7473_000515 [Penicillium subrubescens]OKO91581.1 hypothetical protein PENSUB_12988 [Penicillium subrubescens]
MQFKLLAALLFAGTALAAPQGTSTSSSSSEDDSILLDSVPSSILTVIATAIPATWLADIMDPSSSASIMSEIEAGTLPAWYNNLPSSVKAWATSAYGLDITATDSANAATTTAAGAVATATGAATTASTTGSVESSSAAVSGAVSSATSVASKATSAAASSAHASATSTGGAPVATGGVAMSIMGAAGILGLALAL